MDMPEIRKGVKSTIDSYSAVLCDAVKKDYIQFGQQCCSENEGEDSLGVGPRQAL